MNTHLTPTYLINQLWECCRCLHSSGGKYVAGTPCCPECGHYRCMYCDMQEVRRPVRARENLLHPGSRDSQDGESTTEPGKLRNEHERQRIHEPTPQLQEDHNLSLAPFPLRNEKNLQPLSPPLKAADLDPLPVETTLVEIGSKNDRKLNGFGSGVQIAAGAGDYATSIEESNYVVITPELEDLKTTEDCIIGYAAGVVENGSLPKSPSGIITNIRVSLAEVSQATLQPMLEELNRGNPAFIENEKMVNVADNLDFVRGLDENEAGGEKKKMMAKNDPERDSLRSAPLDSAESIEPECEVRETGWRQRSQEENPSHLEPLDLVAEMNHWRFQDPLGDNAVPNFPKDGEFVYEDASFTVEELNDEDDGVMSNSERYIRPWQYEDAVSEENITVLPTSLELESPPFVSDCEAEKDDRESWLEALRAERRGKRMRKPNGMLKRSLSVAVDSDTDEEDLTFLQFGVKEVGSSARRLRRRTGAERSSLNFEDPPPKILEFSEPGSDSEVILISEHTYGKMDAQKDVQARLELLNMQARSSGGNITEMQNDISDSEQRNASNGDNANTKYILGGVNDMTSLLDLDVQERTREIQRRCLLIDPPIESDVLSHLPSFRNIVSASFTEEPTQSKDLEWELFELNLIAEFNNYKSIQGFELHKTTPTHELEGDSLMENEDFEQADLNSSFLKTLQSGRDDDEQSLKSDVSDALSLVSIAESVFSYVSGSSMSSVAGPVGAGERFVALLLGDGVIHPLCTEGLASITPERFERNFRRMLKEFAVHLRQEASNIQQRNAAQFVRFRARNSAHILCNRLIEVDAVDKKKFAPVPLVEVELGVEVVESDDSSSNESEDGLNDLQHLELFIKNSKAIDLLREKLRDFVYPPQPMLAVVSVDDKLNDSSDAGLVAQSELLEVKNTIAHLKAEIAIQCTDKTSTYWELRWTWLRPKILATYFMTITRLQRPPVTAGRTRIEWRCGCGQKIVDDFIEARPGGINRYRDELSKKSSLRAQLRAKDDTKSRSLFERVGSCIVSLTIYCIINPVPTHESALRFYFRFSVILTFFLGGCFIIYATIVSIFRLGFNHRKCTNFPKSHGSPIENSHLSQEDSDEVDRRSTSSSMSKTLAGSCRSLRSVFSFGSKASSSTENGLPLHSRPFNPALSSTTPLPAPPLLQDLLFLLLCYNEGRYATRLCQLDLVTLNAKSDKILFQLLRANYRSMRPRFTSFLSLRTLEWIKFVHFEMYRSELVDVRKINDIPPPEHVEYKYAPTPPDVIPPVGDRHMMHLFEHPECADDETLCLSRFPKKLKEKLKCQGGINPGWGLQFVEGWDFRKLWILVFTLFGMGSMVLGVLWAVYKHSIQDAFAIAAYMMTFAALTVGLVQALLVM